MPVTPDHITAGLRAIQRQGIAQLIAAAPDLLEACKHTRAYLDQVDTDNWPPALDAMIRAAIAKAEAP